MSSVKEQETVTIQAPRKKRRSRTQTLAVKSSGPTGPRTKRGKMKSRYNALKHGIFADVVLRGSVLRERREDYENLLQAFRESWQPVGGLEEFLVEKLAQLAWRKGRLIKAETAVVMKQTEFLRDDRLAKKQQIAEGTMLLALRQSVGTLAHRRNPFLLDKSLEMLKVLEGAVEARGFDPETDESVLRSIYGDAGETEGLFLRYRMFSAAAKKAIEKQSEKHSSGGDHERQFLQALREEFEELYQRGEKLRKRIHAEWDLEEGSLSIPAEEELDRLLRYEARLDGAFDRTLQQLERLQRTRLGQPVAPAVKVDVTH